MPRLAESVSEAVLAEWLRPDGASVRTDEPVVTLETDKAAVEIAAPEAGVLRHARPPGDRVVVGDVIARIEPAAAPGEASGASAGVADVAANAASAGPVAAAPGTVAARAPAVAKVAGTGAAPAPVGPANVADTSAVPAAAEPAYGPAARRLLEEHGLSPGSIAGTGRGGRILKEDVVRHLERSEPAAPVAPATPAAPAARAAAPAPPAPARRAPDVPAAPVAPAVPAAPSGAPGTVEGERLVPMSRIRRRIAERLVQAQHTAAILTTFNEVDMSAVLEARQRYRDSFEQRHGVRLGLMSFFARACVIALREYPEVNAEIRGDSIAYRDVAHLGVAVATERGLIVPVVHDAHRMSFADIEREIARLAARARDESLSLDEIVGGTFTISNGGVYGSLLSTPILNPPQSGILGMHKIEKRPVVVNDQIVIRPMMYVALSYDHRLVDGEQAVSFLVRVKECLEAPERMLLEA